jgi:hypothetical protein
MQGWLYFHTGDRLHAHYVNGVANGEARYYSVDGNVFFGRLRDNWRHGECLYIESSGSRSCIFFLHSVCGLHGICMSG